VFEMLRQYFTRPELSHCSDTGDSDFVSVHRLALLIVRKSVIFGTFAIYFAVT